MATRKSDRRASNRRLEYLLIEGVTPELEGGRYPLKRIVGDTIEVGADILDSGRDHIAARLLYLGPEHDDWSSAPMRYDYDSDRWYGHFPLDRIGRWLFTIEAWTDHFGAWRDALKARVAAGGDVAFDLAEGARLARAASRSTRSAATRASLVMTAKVLEDRRNASVETRIRRALDEEFLSLMHDFRRPDDLTRLRREIAIMADRERAGFAAWYVHPSETGSNGLADGDGSPSTPRHLVAASLAQAADLGFDTVSFRPNDVGSLAEFDQVAHTARELGVEIALEYGLHCPPDHPWVADHPDWLHMPETGSPEAAIAQSHAGYPINFWCDDRDGLWSACRDIVQSWIDRGVHVFSVSEPHRKPLAFWEWLIHDVQHDHPDALFLARTFARPKHAMSLAKAGFTMSYTYFPWKTTGYDLRDYFTELTTAPASDFFRGNLIINPSEIANEHLAIGTAAAFRARLLLAGTLLPLYGLCGGCAGAAGAAADIRRLNSVRREQPALQQVGNVTFHTSENPAVLFYRKARGTVGDRDLLIAVNTDARRAQETMVHVPIHTLGIDDAQPYVVRDLLTGANYFWRGSRNYVRLDPADQAGHILLVER